MEKVSKVMMNENEEQQDRQSKYACQQELRHVKMMDNNICGQKTSDSEDQMESLATLMHNEICGQKRFSSKNHNQSQVNTKPSKCAILGITFFQIFFSRGDFIVFGIYDACEITQEDE